MLLQIWVGQPMFLTMCVLSPLVYQRKCLCLSSLPTSLTAFGLIHSLVAVGFGTDGFKMFALELMYSLQHLPGATMA